MLSDFNRPEDTPPRSWAEAAYIRQTEQVNRVVVESRDLAALVQREARAIRQSYTALQTLVDKLSADEVQPLLAELAAHKADHDAFVKCIAAFKGNLPDRTELAAAVINDMYVIFEDKCFSTSREAYAELRAAIVRDLQAFRQTGDFPSLGPEPSLLTLLHDRAFGALSKRLFSAVFPRAKRLFPYTAFLVLNVSATCAALSMWHKYL